MLERNPTDTSTPNDDADPFKGPTRLPIPKFKGDKRSFEAWYAGSSIAGSPFFPALSPFQDGRQ